jgi:hypothetical protein
MAQVDINNAPAGGFQKGAWYWDPKANQARRWTGTKFGAPGEAVAVDGEAGAKPAASNSPLQQINDAIQGSFQKLQNEVIQRFGEYQSGQPFKVDQVLADKTKNAAEQIDPYYNQILGDYLTGVQRKIDRGVNDTKDLLGELTANADSYTDKSQVTIANAIEQAQKGFADSGLFGSGDQLRAEGQINQNGNADMADYNRKVGSQTKQLATGLQRNTEDLLAGKKDFVTNLEQNRYTDTQNRAADLTKEAGQDYVRGYQATLPTQLQSASGFDLLKSIGIYS